LATGRTLPAINKEVAIYDSSTKEVLLFNDGIQVKKQKENRGNTLNHLVITLAPFQSDGDKRVSRSRIQTDVIMLQKASGDYIHLIEGVVLQW
jgi:hypothetical protein